MINGLEAANECATSCWNEIPWASYLIKCSMGIGVLDFVWPEGNPHNAICQGTEVILIAQKLIVINVIKYSMLLSNS